MPLISETDLEEGQRTKERLLCLRCWEGFQIRFLILDTLITANINMSKKYQSQTSFQINEICMYDFFDVGLSGGNVDPTIIILFLLPSIISSFTCKAI